MESLPRFSRVRGWKNVRPAHIKYFIWWRGENREKLGVLSPVCPTPCISVRVFFCVLTSLSGTIREVTFPSSESLCFLDLSPSVVPDFNLGDEIRDLMACEATVAIRVARESSNVRLRYFIASLGCFLLNTVAFLLRCLLLSVVVCQSGTIYMHWKQPPMERVDEPCK